MPRFIAAVVGTRLPLWRKANSHIAFRGGHGKKNKSYVAWHTRHKTQYGGKIKKERKIGKKRKEKIERRMGGNARGKTITSLGVIRKGI